MPRKMRLFVSFIIAAVIFAAFPGFANANNPDLQACLKECGSRIQKCAEDMNSVKEELKTDCADIEACRRLDMSVDDSEALKGFCLATCEANSSCASSALPSLVTKTPAEKPPAALPPSPRPPTASTSPTTWTMPTKHATTEQLACEAKHGAWVEKWDPNGLRYECMTVGRLHNRLKELEDRVSSLKGGGDPEAIARMEQEIQQIKHAAPPDFAKQNEARFKALEDLLDIEVKGDAIRSKRLDQHANVLKHHTEQLRELDVEEGHDIIGFDAGGYGFIGTQMPYGRARPGVGVMARFRGHLDADWDLGVGGNLCYSGEDPSGASLKCVGGELSFMYRVEDWFAIRFGVDTEWRLDPLNRAESSSHGPLFGVDFTPGVDEWRFLAEINAGVKATVVPEAVEAGLALHAIPDLVLTTAIGVRFK